MQKSLTPQVRIAIVTILAIVMLPFGIQLLGGVSSFLNDAHYRIKFNDITGLSTPTPVCVRDFKASIIKNIDYDHDKLGESVTVGVDAEKILRISEGITAETISDTMGNVKAILQFGKSTKFSEPNGWIDGGTNGGTLGDLKSMVPSIQKILPELNSTLGSVNTLPADPALQSSVHDVDKVTTDLIISTRELNTLFTQVNGSLPAMTTKAGKTMDSANGMMVNASKGITEARGAIHDANTMISSLNNRVNRLDVEATMAKVSATLDNTNPSTAKLSSNEGTMGLMPNDASLYKNLNSTTYSVDSLLTNLKACPKRYVYFSISGRKDKQLKYDLDNIINVLCAKKAS